MGSDKALLEIDGTPFLTIVAGALRDVTDDLLLVGREEVPIAGLAITAVPDDRPAKRGPLAGLATALATMTEGQLILVAVDQPFVATDTLRRLAALADDRPVVPVAGGARQVTCAVYPAAIAGDVIAEDEDDGSIQSLLDRIAWDPVEETTWRSWGEDGRSWFSIDTPEALVAASKRFGSP